MPFGGKKVPRRDEKVASVQHQDWSRSAFAVPLPQWASDWFFLAVSGEPVVDFGDRVLGFGGK